MSNVMPWIRFYLDDWASGTDGMTPEQRGIYIMLLIRMYDKKSPVKEDFKTLSRVCNCTEKKFTTVVDYLMKNNKLIQTTDKGLWNLRVEEELKDFTDKQEHISQVRSEAGKKGAQAKMLKKQFANDYVEANGKQNDFLLQANDKQNQAIQNQNQIYKKTNTIVLSKKENASEDLATEVSVQSETTDDAVEQQLDHNTPSSENQTPVSQQKSTQKKTKRSRSERGCRLPHDFEPDLEYAIDKGLTHDEASLEFEKFKNYWLAKSGQGAIKKDWKLTWYNWVISDYGLLAQKKAKLEKEKRNGRDGNYSQRQKSFTERLTESFESSRHDFSSGDDHEEDQSRVSIDLQEWERIDEAGGRKSLGCLQPSTEIVQCESFG
ncbi:YdaU family protein [Bartonella schoenbuchensis]|uniref:YdaU family protein n=1 Tax=Bartonella schoenbuchensis TaxID=165694 RepID=UPI0031CCACEA